LKVATKRPIAKSRTSTVLTPSLLITLLRVAIEVLVDHVAARAAVVAAEDAVAVVVVADHVAVPAAVAPSQVTENS